MVTVSSDRSQDWQDLVDEESDQLERPLLADPWVTPGASLGVQDGCLEVDGDLWYESLRDVKAEAPMLEDFVRLAESGRDSDQAVLEYARRWGLLELCQHQLPVDHGPVHVPIALATAGGGRYTFPISTTCHGLGGREPVAAWLYWSRQAAALLAILSHLRRSEPAPSKDWESLCENPPWVAPERLEEGTLANARLSMAGLVGGRVPLEMQRKVASGAIETWIQLAGASIELRWPGVVPVVGFRTGGLFGALGLQILLAAGSTSLVMCPGCGIWHAPPKGRHRPAKYCQTCRKANVPHNRASQMSRAKKSAEAVRGQSVQGS